MLHNMKVENPHPFTQFLAFIFHFFCYMNGWFMKCFFPLLGLLCEACDSFLPSSMDGHVVVLLHPTLCAEQAKAYSDPNAEGEQY